MKSVIELQNSFKNYVITVLPVQSASRNNEWLMNECVNQDKWMYRRGGEWRKGGQKKGKKEGRTHLLTRVFAKQECKWHVCCSPKYQNTSNTFINTCERINNKTGCVCQSSRAEKSIHVIRVQIKEPKILNISYILFYYEVQWPRV